MCPGFQYQSVTHIVQTTKRIRADHDMMAPARIAICYSGYIYICMRVQFNLFENIGVESDIPPTCPKFARYTSWRPGLNMMMPRKSDGIPFTHYSDNILQ